MHKNNYRLIDNNNFNVSPQKIYLGYHILIVDEAYPLAITVIFNTTFSISKLKSTQIKS